MISMPDSSFVTRYATLLEGCVYTRASASAVCTGLQTAETRRCSCLHITIRRHCLAENLLICYRRSNCATTNPRLEEPTKMIPMLSDLAGFRPLHTTLQTCCGWDTSVHQPRVSTVRTSANFSQSGGAFLCTSWQRVVRDRCSTFPNQTCEDSGLNNDGLVAMSPYVRRLWLR
ncbi:hypothetical protein OBBRIDRAFT_35278 [Obba rivulosa]|uniref:Uncharacterized protein n=1 Tax=Obba rivulosa TaxID=1052685 RepID=A0A8E2DJB2_9APHY|nr:hypothetical protein OBBRIDRAFT_35278 [Obba rivulosa]